MIDFHENKKGIIKRTTSLRLIKAIFVVHTLSQGRIYVPDCHKNGKGGGTNESLKMQDFAPFPEEKFLRWVGMFLVPLNIS